MAFDARHEDAVANPPYDTLFLGFPSKVKRSLERVLGYVSIGASLGYGLAAFLIRHIKPRMNELSSEQVVNNWKGWALRRTRLVCDTHMGNEESTKTRTRSGTPHKDCPSLTPRPEPEKLKMFGKLGRKSVKGPER